MHVYLNLFADLINQLEKENSTEKKIIIILEFLPDICQSL